MPDFRRAAAALVVTALVAFAAPARPAAVDRVPKKDSAKGSKRQTTPATTGSRARPPSAPIDPRDAQQRQAAERDRLTARIAEIKAQIAAGERSRTGAAAALTRAERALAMVNRRLDDLARKQRDALEQAGAIDRQRTATEGQIAARQRAWDVAVRLLDQSVPPDPLRTMLADGNPGQAVLMQGDLGYFGAAQTRDLAGLRTRVDDLQAERRRAEEARLALATQAEAERSARDSLAADQATRRQALAQLGQQIARQRDTAAALEADEARLGRIVAELQKTIDRRAAEDRARREAAARKASEQAAARKAPARGSKETAKPPEEPLAVEPPTPADAAVASGAFAQLQGRLRLPVRGTVTGRFGGARGSGGGTWKGVFVRTDSGADVHAVAAGRVIFADELRGFGNLLIIDHGDQYLSIYGNNDALLRKAGDAVRSGDVVAHAGNSIGDDQTGLYFELRFRGRPFDPLSWTAGR